MASRDRRRKPEDVKERKPTSRTKRRRDKEDDASDKEEDDASDKEEDDAREKEDNDAKTTTKTSKISKKGKEKKINQQREQEDEEDETNSPMEMAAKVAAWKKPILINTMTTIGLVLDARSSVTLKFKSLETVLTDSWWVNCCGDAEYAHSDDPKPVVDDPVRPVSPYTPSFNEPTVTLGFPSKHYPLVAFLCTQEKIPISEIKACVAPETSFLLQVRRPLALSMLAVINTLCELRYAKELVGGEDEDLPSAEKLFTDVITVMAKSLPMHIKLFYA